MPDLHLIQGGEGGDPPLLPLEMVRQGIADCTEYIAHTLTYERLGDDYQDYLPAASEILDELVNILVADEPEVTAAEYLEKLKTGSLEDIELSAWDALDFYTPLVSFIQR